LLSSENERLIRQIADRDEKIGMIGKMEARIRFLEEENCRLIESNEGLLGWVGGLAGGGVGDGSEENRLMSLVEQKECSLAEQDGLISEVRCRLEVALGEKNGLAVENMELRDRNRALGSELGNLGLELADLAAQKSALLEDKARHDSLLEKQNEMISQASEDQTLQHTQKCNLFPLTPTVMLDQLVSQNIELDTQLCQLQKDHGKLKNLKSDFQEIKTSLEHEKLQNLTVRNDFHSRQQESDQNLANLAQINEEQNLLIFQLEKNYNPESEPDLFCEIEN
jgi:hypothetical protein